MAKRQNRRCSVHWELSQLTGSSEDQAYLSQQLCGMTDETRWDEKTGLRRDAEWRRCTNRCGIVTRYRCRRQHSVKIFLGKNKVQSRVSVTALMAWPTFFV
jgi:hypothetical protein